MSTTTVPIGTALPLHPSQRVQPDVEAAAIDGLLYMATLWLDRDPTHFSPNHADRTHIRSAVYAMISAQSRAHDRASHGITFDGLWLQLVEAVRARESFAVGGIPLEQVLGSATRLADDHEHNQAARDRLDAAVNDAAKVLYRGART